MKKYLLCFILIIFLIKANAQYGYKRDTMYYLVDTLHTPKKDRMLDVFIESNTKCFVIKCPCLQYNSDPVFTYRIADASFIIDKKNLKKINTTNITTLVDIAKGNLGNLTTYPVFMFIEKNNGAYTVHTVHLQPPMKPQEPIRDYIIITDTISKKNK